MFKHISFTIGIWYDTRQTITLIYTNYIDPCFSQTYMKISYHYNHFHCNFSIIFNIWLGVDRWVRLVITSPRLLSGDVLLFYVSFSLLLLLFLLLLLHHPNCCRVMYCYSTFLFHYYYYSYYSSSTHFCQLCFSEMP